LQQGEDPVLPCIHDYLSKNCLSAELDDFESKLKAPLFIMTIKINACFHRFKEIWKVCQLSKPITEAAFPSSGN